MNGELLENGSIMFAPDDRDKGVSSGGEITDGKFSIPAHQGLVSGTYTVRVYSADNEAEEAKPKLPGPGIKAPPERIPSKYNMKSELKLDVGDQPAVFDLDIKTK